MLGQISYAMTHCGKDFTFTIIILFLETKLEQKEYVCLNLRIVVLRWGLFSLKDQSTCKKNISTFHNQN